MTSDSVWDKFHEELDEFHRAIAQEPKGKNQQAELGDLLFLPWSTLPAGMGWTHPKRCRALNRRFISRFQLVEAVADKPLTDYSVEEAGSSLAGGKGQTGQWSSTTRFFRERTMTPGNFFGQTVVVSMLLGGLMQPVPAQELIPH